MKTIVGCADNIWGDKGPSSNQAHGFAALFSFVYFQMRDKIWSCGVKKKKNYRDNHKFYDLFSWWLF